MIKAKNGNIRIKAETTSAMLTDFSEICDGVKGAMLKTGAKKEEIINVLQDAFNIGMCDTPEEKLEYMKNSVIKMLKEKGMKEYE